ncbi:SgcJ/EcaC family oxidoreductase [Cryobacterium frigoriphilum]|uniref:SgcJ/EcaC family oxidoreductase n=1 Tax=Cryobacterium frigoriphilum TaxID=1259150 RepID=A0A4R9A782_9MICO|nr:SgcJ/EcaC family oxidoreductase [Cryobacterium frigoriphilum]TFD52954.1 SgcJ/EcaC family oxidoreductase [Cryobacterium frigoriphilum]
MTTQLNPVTQALDAYAAAVAAQDVDGFVALYDDDVVVYDSWGQWQYSGLSAWRGMVTDWFGSLGSDTVEVVFADVQTMVSREVAFGHAAVTFTAISARGERTRSMTNRLTINLARNDDAWKIVHEHSSLPIDMETGAAIFERA